jgi:hypothetical protein
MSKMVERVARVLFHWQYGHNRWDEAEPEEREDVMEAARAVIEAMREPTDKMREQIGWAFAVMVVANRLSLDEDLPDELEQLFWQVAIDEALK